MGDWDRESNDHEVKEGGAQHSIRGGGHTGEVRNVDIDYMMYFGVLIFVIVIAVLYIGYNMGMRRAREGLKLPLKDGMSALAGAGSTYVDATGVGAAYASQQRQRTDAGYDPFVGSSRQGPGAYTAAGHGAYGVQLFGGGVTSAQGDEAIFASNNMATQAATTAVSAAQQAAVSAQQAAQATTPAAKSIAATAAQQAAQLAVDQANTAAQHASLASQGAAASGTPAAQQQAAQAQAAASNAASAAQQAQAAANSVGGSVVASFTPSKTVSEEQALKLYQQRKTGGDYRNDAALLQQQNTAV